MYGTGIEDMLHGSPSIDKIAEAIGWEPERSLEDILNDVTAERRALPAGAAAQA